MRVASPVDNPRQAYTSANFRYSDRAVLNVKIRAIQQSELEATYALLCASGWSHRLKSVSELSALIAASQRAFVAVAPNGQVAGFARALSDGLSNGYISMLVVDPAFRRRGIGRALVDAITADSAGVTWVLRAGREGASDFFSRLGFSPSAIAMERKRVT